MFFTRIFTGFFLVKFLPVFEIADAACDVLVSVSGFKELHTSSKMYSVSEKDNLPFFYSHNLQACS